MLRDLARALRLGGEVIAPTDLGAASARLLTVQCHRDLYYTPFPFVPLMNHHLHQLSYIFNHISRLRIIW